jgi:hypothetical protein
VKGAPPEPVFRVVEAEHAPVPPEATSHAWRAAGRRWANRLRPVRALAWSEWFAHQRLMVVFAFLWLAAVWLLPLAVNPLWTLAVGAAFALMAGPAFGGSDVIHGCEEFSFAGAATRGQRFLARLVVGGTAVLTFNAMSILALERNLSDVLLRLVLASGSAPAQVSRPEMLYALVLAVPFTAFAMGFSLSALASSRTVAFTSWLWAALGALALLRGGLQLEEIRWDTLNGRIALPLLLLVSGMTLWVGGRFYRRKEAGSGNVPLRVPPSFWGWLAGLVIAALGLVVLVSWFVGNFTRLI